MKDTKRRGRRESSNICTSCHSGSCIMESVDVTILYSNDAEEWNDYLVWCFQELPETLHVRHQCLENLALPLTITRIGFYRRAKVQIVILSPEFLDFVVNNPNVILGKLFEPSRVLALMCGVSESDVSSLHRASLASFDSWKKMTVVENNKEFVMSLITSTLDLIHANKRCLVERPDQSRSKAFRLNPSKTREGFAKVSIELQNAIPEEAVVSVVIETGNESIPVNVSRFNPYLLKFVVPDRFFGVSQHVSVHVKCGVDSLGVRLLKCESKMGELNQLLQTLLSPCEFMCQTLGLTSGKLDQLDHILVENFRKNISTNGFSLLDFNEDVCLGKVEEEVPTLLHFAAKMGLRELCSAILDCPGAAAACQMRNCRGRCPSDLAEIAGHSCLANMLENFTRLSETAEMYTYMKSVTENGCNVDYENLRARFGVGIEGSDHDLVKTSETREEEISAMHLEASDASVDSRCSRSQQELLQLLEDFKREKYSLAEVELLFHNWQLRQKTRSFKEKQEQLKSMRQHYDCLQKSCRADGKKSFFDRLRALLVSNGKKDVPGVKVCGVHVRTRSEDDFGHVATSCGSLNGRRPYSNASNSSRSSSSLSNRSSTLSGFSVGSTTDSGAQSDIGDDQFGIELTTVNHSSPKLLDKPLVVCMVDNFQYMHAATAVSTGGSSNRQSSPSTAPRKLSPASSAIVVKTSRSSCRHRNPMPIPRKLPSLRLSKSKRWEHNSPDYVLPDEEDSQVTDCSLPPLPPPSPPVQSQIGYHDQGSTRMNAPSRDGYLLMDSNARCPVKSSNPLSEPEYYNISRGDHYMDMSSTSKVASTQSNTSVNSATVNSHLSRSFGHRRCQAVANPAYVNSSQRSGVDFDPDRCDSVPDFPPPAPPIHTHRPVLPPPLPPRNPGLPKAK